MDKIFEQLTKLLPAPFLVGLLAVATLFFAVYYSRGYRSYTDALGDTVFKNFAIVIAASACLYFINAAPIPSRSSSPVLIIPLFDNDQRDQFRVAVSTQLESRLDTLLRRSNSVMHVNSFFNDVDTAGQTAKRYGAIAAIYDPKVVEQKDNAKVCFRLLLLPSSSKTYPLVPQELPDSMLTELISTISGKTVSAPQDAASKNFEDARLKQFENRLQEMQNQINAVVESERNRKTVNVASYDRRRALVIGINTYEASSFPSLQFAESDARSLASELNEEGFEVQYLLGRDATAEKIKTKLAQIVADSERNDLLLVYYTGLSTAVDTPDGAKMLLMMPSDVRSNDLEGGISVATFRTQMESSRALHKLLIVDGCNGTSGFSEGLSKASGIPSDGKAAGSVFQFLSGTQDSEYGLEDREIGGGVFTQMLLRSLQKRVPHQPMLVSELFARVSAAVSNYKSSSHFQHPKLVTLGVGDVVWPPREAKKRD